jgi:hypothetical protein
MSENSENSEGNLKKRGKENKTKLGRGNWWEKRISDLFSCPITEKRKKKMKPTEK